MRHVSLKSVLAFSAFAVTAFFPSGGAAGDFRFAPDMAADWKGEGGAVFASASGLLVFEGDPAERPVAEVRRAPDAPPERVEFAPDGTRPGRWFLDLPEEGWYEVVLRPATGGAGSRFAAAVVGPPIPEAWRADSVFGIWTVHGDAALVRLAGARWNRRMTAFHSVTRRESEEFGGLGPGEPHAQSAENAGIVPYDERDGLRQVGVFSFGLPMWTMDVPEGVKKPSFGSLFLPARDWNDVARCVAAYARTHALPRDFSIYNEPLAHFKGKPAQIADYARAVRAGLKAADPSFRVGGPGLYSIRIRDLSAIEEGGLLESLDFLDLHAYVGGTPPEGEFVRKIDMLRDWLAERGRPDMPVYLTEFGWTAAAGTWQPPVDRATQARYVARSLALAWSRRVDALVFFALDYRTEKAGEAAFSLVGRDGRPEAGYAAFAAVSRHFAASEPLGEAIPAPGVHLVAGRRAGRVQFALWSENPASENGPVSLPWPVERAFSLYGSPLPPAAEWTPGPDPVFFETPVLAVMPETMPVFAGKATAPARIAGTALRWPADAASPHLEAEVEFAEAVPAGKAALCVEWDNAGDASPSAIRVPSSGAAAPGGREAFAVPVPGFPGAPVFGRRIDGVARLETDGGPCGAKRFSCTVLAAWPDGSGAAPWADFTAWGPWGWDGVASPDTGDCRAAVRLFHSGAGLGVELAVADDEHAASVDPARLWEKDSVQIGFDMDFGKPWEAGFAGAGSSQTLGGHRVFEFSLGGAPGGGVAFLERSMDDTLPAGTVRPDVTVAVSRDEAARRTRYEAFFPWAQLGAAAAPPCPGDAVGVAIAVNDADPSRNAPRRALRLFGGIVESKEPESFGPCFLRPSSCLRNANK